MLSTVGILLVLAQATAPQGDARSPLDRAYQSAPFQRELPGRGDVAARPGSGSDRDQRDAARRARGPREPGEPADSDRRRLALEGRTADWMQVVLMGLVVASVLAVLLMIGYAFAKIIGNRGVRAEKAKPPPRAAGATLLDPGGGPATNLPDPDVLAREGRFAEAIHALLLRGLSHLAQARHQEIPQAATSREFLRGLASSDPSKGKLRILVDATERAVFARLRVGADEFAVCRVACREMGALA